MRTWALLAALLLTAAAGCLSDDSPSGKAGDGTGTGPADDATHGPGAPKVIDGSGAVTAGAGNDLAGSFTLGAGGADFSVPADATLMFIELSWDSPALSFDLCIHAPADGDIQGTPVCGETVDGGGPGTPAGLVTATRAAPEAGDGWQVTVAPDGPSANVEYQLKVTLFFGETAVPDGYTALA